MKLRNYSTYAALAVFCLKFNKGVKSKYSKNENQSLIYSPRKILGKLVFIFMLIVGFSTAGWAQCSHTIRLTDTWGDGWNGGSVSVSVNGTVVLTNITLATGAGPLDFSISVTSGQTIRVYETAAGSWPLEMRVTVLNNVGTTILAAFDPVSGTATTGGTTVSANCAVPSCTNTSPWITATAPTNNTPLTISTCTFQTEYNTITGVTAGNTYQSAYNLGGFITVRSGTFNGPIVASGNSPLNWTATVSGTYFIHYNTNSACGTATNCGTSTITCTSCPPVPSVANDLVCNATSISCGATLSGTTVAATNSGTGENQTCGTSQTQPGVWYVVPGNGQQMTASLCGNAWDSKISVFSGTNCSTLTCVGGIDDNGPACVGTPASFSWNSVAGLNYYILVHGYSSTSAFSLALTCQSPPFQSSWVSMNTGTSNWCPGETRTVSVTVTNNGSSTWTNAAPDINIGVKWNAEADYFVRVDANNLAPGATQTYYLTVTAPMTPGTNNLTFDVVNEGNCWFGNNNGSCGPGNTVYTSPAITIAPNYTITGTTTICAGSTTDLNTTDPDWTSLPTGGTITTIGNERIHTFTTSGTFSSAQAVNNAKVLVVAGGGGGGLRHAGGGGGGGLLYNNSLVVPAGGTTVNVGAGGAGVTAGTGNVGANNGQNSQFGGGMISIGGGFGSCNGQAAGTGGSGGGGSNNLSGQPGIAGQGNKGGNQGCSPSTTVSGCGGACGGCYPFGCGGGGAGAAALNDPTQGSAGGIGLQFNISGANVFYAGGGGGGRDGAANGYAGGTGGGGAGGGNSGTLAGSNGLVNTGGGGGGGGANGGASGVGGNGGSGIVIVRYTRPIWTSSNTSVATVDPLSGLVTGVSAGTTTITYNSPGGCSASTLVTVNPLNTVAAGQNSTVCQGSVMTAISLATTGATGATVTGLPAGVTGSWSANVVTISGTPTASGTFNYTVTTTGGCPPATTTGTITVNTLSVAPTSITGTTTICAGGSTTLTLSGGSAGTGAAPQWFAGSCGSAVIGTGNSITVSPGANTTYFVRYNGTCNTTTCASVAVTVQTLSVAPTSITGTTTICAGGSTTLTLSGGSAGTGAAPQWFSGSCGSAVIGTGNSITVSPGANTTYFVRFNGTCNTTTCASVIVTVNTLSTPITTLSNPGTICPNTNTSITASGGVAGSGSTINWYTGPNGTGTLVGTGTIVTVAPTANTTYYVRREGTCNTTADASVTVNVKNYVYAANGTSSNTYCTDNAGWHHFFVGDDIIFSLQGNISLAPIGYPVASIADNGAYYQETQGPGIAPGCSSNQQPGEERFEMERSWNVDMGGGTPIGSYDIRFYYQPAERTAIETAAAAWMATYPDCGYSYKYNPGANGFFWFKNSGSNYVAPIYESTQYSATVASTTNGINYAQWTGIPSFSGGSGSVILVPNAVLPVELTSFTALCNSTNDEVSVRWTTASEHNSSHFNVERSTDGSSWDLMTTTNAAGNSTITQVYEVKDFDVRAYETIYYRLQQFDQDGASKQYGPVSVSCSDGQNSWEVFPNPAGSEVTILLKGDFAAESTQIHITDINGKSMQVIQHEQGQLITVDLRAYAPGVYIVRLMDGKNNDQFVRLVKQ